MELNEYQKKAGVTARYPRIGSNLNYPLVSLGGEAGEVLDKWQKILRDKNEIVDEESRVAMAKELGDVFWCLQQSATELGYTLEEIAQMNLAKLAKRAAEGKIHGEGDNR